MNKIKLTLDTDTINMENEIHVNNFSKKIQKLAQHCVNYIEGSEDNSQCTNHIFIREFHDDDNDSTIDSYMIPSIIKKNINTNYNLYDMGFSPLLNS